MHTRRVTHILTERFSWPEQKAQVSSFLIENCPMSVVNVVENFSHPVSKF